MKVLPRLFAAALVCAIGLPAAPPPISTDEYRQRRAAVRSAISENVFILIGGTERDHGEIRTGFFQEANFYYLTGWTEPGAILVITPKSDVLLLPRRDPSLEHWTGRKAGPNDTNIQTTTGFQTVASAEAFEKLLPGWLAEGRNIYTLTDLPTQVDAIRKLAPLREIRGAAEILARQRMKKSLSEIALIQYATDTTVDAHIAAWKRMKPGLAEYQIAATLTNIYFERGCERHAYAPIAGSGPNSTVLHYNRNTRKLDAGDLLLVDAGAECAMYASDLTRTMPVSGKWTKRQREIYDLVLEAQKAAIAAIKPGVMLGSRTNRTGLQKMVWEFFESRGGMGKYFTHGLGHHVGLDVHDATDPALPLEAGMVITIEPGIYIPEEGIGVRIEDVVLVTPDGAKVLSERLPREADEIERFLATR